MHRILLLEVIFSEMYQEISPFTQFMVTLLFQCARKCSQGLGSVLEYSILS